MKILKLILLFSLFPVLFWCTPLAAAEVKIAVAANFVDVVRKLAPIFEEKTGHKTRISFGSTGKLYAQISNGAPFDVFLAADAARPAKAIQDGLAIAGSDFVYAKGKLVFWSVKANKFNQAEDWLKQSNFKHIAIANPETAPYGMAAKQALKKIGVWDNLNKKLVRGESIAQTFQFIATGNAEAGFIAFSQLEAWQKDPGAAWIIPSNYFDPIEQGAVLLKKGGGNPAARVFLDFLKSDESLRIITQSGYST